MHFGSDDMLDILRDVQRGPGPIPITKDDHGLVGNGAEGREGPEKTDRQHRPEFGAHWKRLHHLHPETQQERSQDVDDECAEREKARERRVDPPGQPIPGKGTRGAADRYEEPRVG